MEASQHIARPWPPCGSGSACDVSGGGGAGGGGGGLVPKSCDPMDYSPPGSSIHAILQARILEWVAILFSRCDVSSPQ